MIPELAMNPLALRILSLFELDEEGNVNFRSFISTLAIFAPHGDMKRKMQYAFDIYDIDGDGYISKEELATVLKMMVGNNLTPEQVDHIVTKTISEADLDKDGRLNFKEFCKVINEQVHNKYFTSK